MAGPMNIGLSRPSCRGPHRPCQGTTGKGEADPIRTSVVMIGLEKPPSRSLSRAESFEACTGCGRQRIPGRVVAPSSIQSHARPRLRNGRRRRLGRLPLPREPRGTAGMASVVNPPVSFRRRVPQPLRSTAACSGFSRQFRRVGEPRHARGNGKRACDRSGCRSRRSGTDAAGHLAQRHASVRGDLAQGCGPAGISPQARMCLPEHCGWAA